MQDEFDYVVIGGGVAGCIVASRLSEDPGVTVCLLEAGPPDTNPFIHIPAGFMKVRFDERFIWPFESEPEASTKNRRILETQGRVLGGGSSINGMLYNRGQPEDFDLWAERGNAGWSYADVLPYFKRTERRIGPGDDAVRGRSGRVPVTDVVWPDQLCKAFFAAARAAGLPLNPDYNAGIQDGVSYFQCIVENGKRRNMARSYLARVTRPRTLDVRTGAHAQSVLFDGRRAVGVTYAHAKERGRSHTIRVRREVIISAGALNTPKLLQCSGIGPASSLRDIGVAVVQDLPVGANLRNHYVVPVVVKTKGVTTINELSRGPRLAEQVSRWMLGKPSIIGLPAAVVSFFGRSDPSLPRPDFQGMFAPASLKRSQFGLLDSFPGATIGIRQHRPDSHGVVRARSSDAFDAPIIRPNYLSAEQDCRVVVSALKFARSLFRSEDMGRYVLDEEMPGNAVRTDDEILDYARGFGGSSYHLIGTARMGPRTDPTTVVDDHLRVHGTEGLRVIDASIMPTMPSANTMAATMMVAEKGADLIRGRSIG